MSKQVWGTYSVKDHCDPNAFVAEVMLYDRLVIPVPPDDKERARWRKAGWQPEVFLPHPPQNPAWGSAPGVSLKFPDPSRVMNFHPVEFPKGTLFNRINPQFFDRQQTLILKPLNGHAGLHG
jgi:hypothetical protein